jgi:sugar phosphate isomerase/epimerase
MNVATTFDTYLAETNENLEEAFLLAKEQGFDAMGIMIKESLEYYLEKKEQFLDSGLKFCIHANLIDTNIASTNEGIRKESIKQFKDAIILAKEISCKIVTFHPGKFRNSLLVQEAYYTLDKSLQELLDFAEKNDVTLCLENMEPRDKTLCVTLTQTQKVLDRHPKLMLTLDLAHVAMVVNSEEELIEYYNSLKSRIAHFHISGIKPRRSHVEVSLKESDVDFTNIIRLIKNTPAIIRIENRERIKNIDSLEFIKQALN